MSRIITDSVLQQPFDKYWDSPPTRREIQRMANKLAQNDSELMGMADTAALILNFLCEVKLSVSREEVEIYVAAKRLQLEEARAKMKAEASSSSSAPAPSALEV
jgi:hypothetical protein